MKSEFDLVIRKSKILDGGGNPFFRADIGIVNGKIQLIQEDIALENTKAVINADGLATAPGFIDVHSHDDLYLISKPSAEEKIFQGITTVITGNCGFSPWPLQKDKAKGLKEYQSVLGGEDIFDKFSEVETFDDYLSILEESHPSINVAALVGHNPVRTAVMGNSAKKPDSIQLKRMQQILDEAMKSGAFGFSTGLIYSPSQYADTDEIIELCKIIGEHQGVYASHIRGESSGVNKSVSEAINIGRKAKVSVQISHLKVGGQSNWGKSADLIQMINAARSEGVEVTADQYPYQAGSGMMFDILPRHVMDGGLEAVPEKLLDPGYRARIKEELLTIGDGDVDTIKNGGFEAVMISASKSYPEYVGKTLYQIAEEEKKDPFDLMFDLVAEDMNKVVVVAFFMGDEDIINIMKSPFVMMGTDGVPNFESKFHPRLTGSAPRILGKYVRDLGVIKLEEAVRKMTSLPARKFGFKFKGLLKEGYDADIVIFDPETIEDGSTYSDPYKSPAGIEWVIVNGKVAVKQNQVIGKGFGKVLRH